MLIFKVNKAHFIMHAHKNIKKEMSIEMKINNVCVFVRMSEREISKLLILLHFSTFMKDHSEVSLHYSSSSSFSSLFLLLFLSYCHIQYIVHKYIHTHKFSEWIKHVEFISEWKKEKYFERPCHVCLFFFLLKLF